MSQGGGATSWTSMNENLMALLEAVLTLAASDASARRPARPAVKPGGHSEDIFIDLSEEEQDEFSCSICYQVLKETMQCLNQHKFCHSCLYVWSTTGQYANRVRCPVCRCQGYYFRNDELDDKIGKKRVRCSMGSCQWTGPLKHLGVHRHTTYGTAGHATSFPSATGESDDDEDEDEDEDEDDSNILTLPYLGRAPPLLPHRSQARFNGTGLYAGTMVTTTRAAAAATATDADDSVTNPTVHTTTTRLNGGTSVRERRSSNIVTDTRERASEETPTPAPAPAPARPSVRQRVHPIRRSTVSRITVRHTDNNNNLASSSPSSGTVAGGGEREREGSQRPTALSPESVLSSPRQPRPPSAPRPPNQPYRRNLPGLSHRRTPSASGRGRGQGQGQQRQESSPTGTQGLRAPPTFNAAEAGRGDGPAPLNRFHDRLQESRDRLEGLMSTFSGELERSRQEMADFQLERERQRREQLTEVRELGRRLGQVAGELRHLLNHRRFRPAESDD